MRIVLLCQSLRYAGGLAVGINFVNQLKNVAPQHQYLVVVSPNAGYETLELPSGSEFYVSQAKDSSFDRWRFEKYHLPRIVKQFKPDVIVGMGNLGLTNPPCKQAIVFHRPQLVYPSKHLIGFGWKKTIVEQVFKSRVRKCLPQTQLVFCQTPVTRERFADSFSYPKENIEIMPNAVSKFAQIPREQTQTPPLLQNDREWFSMFFLSRYYAYKNPEILVRLFRKHSDKLANVRCIITITADQHPRAPKLLADIEKYQLQKHIVNAGLLKQEELAGYFYNSDALFFPTPLESFSGTYLEAMHFECPIITSDIDFARYICGDAAVYFDFWNIDDIAEKIAKIRDDVRLRQKLIENGKQRVSTFFHQWDEIVAQVIKKLERLAGNA